MVIGYLQCHKVHVHFIEQLNRNVPTRLWYLLYVCVCVFSIFLLMHAYTCRRQQARCAQVGSRLSRYPSYPQCSPTAPRS